MQMNRCLQVDILSLMDKSFRPSNLDQPLLLPADLREWLPQDHLALYVSDVVDALDLSAIYDSYAGDGRGQPPYDPAMMVKLLIYAYCIGRPSSRVIERATYEDIAFRVLATNQHPDHDTIAEFRKRHLEALAGLFIQVLRLCQEAGLVKLGQVALDGTKIKANASKHKAMSYDRMVLAEEELKREVADLLRRAQAVDDREDREYGKGHRGDGLPEELARRESRLKKIQEAKAALEREAAERESRDSREKSKSSPRDPGPRTPDAAPEPASGVRFGGFQGTIPPRTKGKAHLPRRFRSRGSLNPIPKLSATSPTRIRASCSIRPPKGSSRHITRRSW